MKNKKGFTLVEIIIVLVIIGILMALAVPAVMRYVKQAGDTKLISQARSVMVSAKDKSVQLTLQHKLPQLEYNETIWKEIIKNSDVDDATIMDMNLNAQKNGCGDFIVQIGDAYVSYADASQKYEVLENYTPLHSIASRLDKTLRLGKAKETINTYFNTKDGLTLDSEGANFGQPIRKALNDMGIDVENHSFTIERKNKAAKPTAFNVSDIRLTNDSIGKTVSVIRYEYPNELFEGTPKIYTGTVKVKNGSDNGQQKYPVMDVSNVEWEEVK